MNRFLKRYLRFDTLAKRLFVLIWGSLIVAQLLAVSAVQLVFIGDEQGLFGRRGIPGPMATLPVLPPTPGVPGHNRRGPPEPRPDARDEDRPRRSGELFLCGKRHRL